jgi:hypothetical protein
MRGGPTVLEGLGVCFPALAFVIVKQKIDAVKERWNVGDKKGQFWP